MSELLSPAGTIESFYAAISNGADAIYLGLDRFSARAYANNFTIDSLKELVKFAHLRNVKIFVTINTIMYDDELEDAFKCIDELAKMNVDAVIVQDLAIANYITNHYLSLHAHASTQMGVDDLDAALLLKEMGFKRVVFARETSLQTIKEIKNKTGLEVEAFIHGALCVSYSGNCYMSSAIGERSGNRGRCAGCCRKYYSLIDIKTEQSLGDGYLLSMKDLNVSNKISDMNFVDSLKIEGRMKEPTYVASVTNTYRKLIDNESPINDPLSKVFNRTYTEGFMNGATASDITNIEKPNNFGYYIGNVIKQNKRTIWIRLNKELSKGDQIRIESENKRDEISVPIINLFDNNFKKIDRTNSVAVISCEKWVKIGSKVFKTKDQNFNKEVEKSLLNKEYRKIPIDLEFTARVNKPLFLKVSYLNYKVFVKSNEIINEALTQSTTKENIEKQLSKLNDTPYTIAKLNIQLDNNCFIPLKLINELRRQAIEKLNEQRLENKIETNKPSMIIPKNHGLHSPKIAIEVSNEKQYEIAKKLGADAIYFKNVIRRNNVKYPLFDGEVLVNGLGGINHYKNNNVVVSDSSLNIVNHVSAAILSQLGVERITLSQEICRKKILSLISNYRNEYGTNPNLELIVYGRSKIMHTKYCPLKRLGFCGKCKEGFYALKDDFASFPILFNDDCTITLLNSKALNLMDCLDDLEGINYYRLVFTTETPEETEEIITAFKDKLNGVSKKKTFNVAKHTKGHFFDNPL